MTFNIALSGLNAASQDLDVRGNNIANSSTTGFKRSRAEFGDVFSSGLQNLSATEVGDGVRVLETRQLFQQGNIAQSDNGLDLAINGEGFFVLENAGDRQFTRAGEFGVDREGFITTNQGARVQGFSREDEGDDRQLGDLEVNTENLKPKRTTNLDANVNLDSREPVLREAFTTFAANGTAMGTVFTPPTPPTPPPPPPLPTPDFSAATFEVRDSEGNLLNTVDTSEGDARAIAAELNQQEGLRVSATTEVTIDDTGFSASAPTPPPPSNIEGDRLTVTAGGTIAEIDLVDGSGTPITFEELARRIDTETRDISVGLNEAGNELTLTSVRGENISFQLDDNGGNGPGTSTLTIDGQANGPDGTASLDLATPNTEATARGVLDFRLEEGFSIEQASGADQLLDVANTATFNPDTIERNAFDPNDPDTFNHSTSSTIFDSLGNDHQLTKFFVKQAPSAANTWSMFVQIDGRDVGPPNLLTEEPTQAEFAVEFSENGSLEFVTDISDGANNIANTDNTADPSKALIKNWTPQETDGEPNGAAGPNPEGPIAIPDPPESSNFVIDLENTTQTGSEFSLNNLQQNGFATGRLAGLDVTDEGIVQARFTNGQSEAIGQVALATFRDNNGLQPVGDTNFAQTLESGDANIGSPRNGPRGSIQASSLEESNVDLSEQLVGLITAQRNFQANAQTIETADTVTQTIINI